MGKQRANWARWSAVEEVARVPAAGDQLLVVNLPTEPFCHCDGCDESRVHTRSDGVARTRVGVEGAGRSERGGDKDVSLLSSVGRNQLLELKQNAGACWSNSIASPSVRLHFACRRATSSMKVATFNWFVVSLVTLQIAATFRSRDTCYCSVPTSSLFAFACYISKVTLHHIKSILVSRTAITVPFTFLQNNEYLVRCHLPR